MADGAGCPNTTTADYPCTGCSDVTFKQIRPLIYTQPAGPVPENVYSPGARITGLGRALVSHTGTKCIQCDQVLAHVRVMSISRARLEISQSSEMTKN